MSDVVDTVVWLSGLSVALLQGGEDDGRLQVGLSAVSVQERRHKTARHLASPTNTTRHLEEVRFSSLLLICVVFDLFLSCGVKVVSSTYQHWCNNLNEPLDPFPYLDGC